jgi:hypothetical protein
VIVGTQDKDKDKAKDRMGGTGQDWQPGQQDRPRDWDQETTDLEQGDQTRPAQPDGTTPLERDQQPMNQKR